MSDTILDTTATEDAEPMAVCESCEGECEESELVEVVTGRDNSGHWRSEHWCEDCACDAVQIEDGHDAWRSLPSNALVSYNLASSYFYYHDGDGLWYTYPEESEDEDEDEDALMDYSTDVLDVLGWPSQSPRRGLLFGVELEMEAKRGNSAAYLVSVLGGSRGTRTGRAILKRDGSLDDGRGVELVTLPYTLEQHQQSGLWQDLLDSRLQAAAMSGAGTTNCGIHVHINRAALSPLTVGKMVVFLNNPDNATFCTEVAQRRSGGYCQRDERKKITTAYTGGVRLPPRTVETWDGRTVVQEEFIDNSRYDIINVTGSRTVEVRMFRGNLRPERVLKNIEFCHALVRFCEASSIKEAANFGYFLGWLGKNRKAYPNLVQFLTEKGWAAPRMIRGQPVPAATLADA